MATRARSASAASTFLTRRVPRCQREQKLRVRGRDRLRFFELLRRLLGFARRYQRFGKRQPELNVTRRCGGHSCQDLDGSVALPHLELVRLPASAAPLGSRLPTTTHARTPAAHPEAVRWSRERRQGASTPGGEPCGSDSRPSGARRCGGYSRRRQWCGRRAPSHPAAARRRSSRVTRRHRGTRQPRGEDGTRGPSYRPSRLSHSRALAISGAYRTGDAVATNS